MNNRDEIQKIVINADYEIFVMLVVLFSLINSVLMFLPVEPQVKQVAEIVDFLISVYLLIDFLFRFLRAKYKKQYFIDFYGWLDLLGSLPVPFLQIARLLRVGLVYRKARTEDLWTMGRVVVSKRANSTLLLVIFMAIVVLDVGGVWVLGAEQSAANANIKTASDALWWGYVTIATVGYGDRYPVTNEGRIVGVFMMTAGVALFSVLTSFVSDWFRRPRKVEEKAEKSLIEGKVVPASQQDKIKHIRRLLDEHEIANQRSLAELRQQLEEVERMVEERPST
jgi:voltage-gated potassium channel